MAGIGIRTDVTGRERTTKSVSVSVSRWTTPAQNVPFSDRSVWHTTSHVVNVSSMRKYEIFDNTECFKKGNPNLRG